MLQLGLERLVKDQKLKKVLKGRKVAVVGHPASVNHQLQHTLDVLTKANVKLSCAFGPQHGLRGEKQDNMIESADFTDPELNIPIYSLYGEVRRPTARMLEDFDVVLVDMLDLGCRIYTFLTTLFYMMEACAKSGKTLWVLDRPNPAGRPIEGHYLDMKYSSFVGAAELVMRHGLTLGEAGLWYKKKMNLDIEYRVVEMKGYNPDKRNDWGWPEGELMWVNPSPNIPRLSTARMYAGTVLIEGTKLSEGRGTTRPLELIGAPGIDGRRIVASVYKMIPKYLKNVTLRPCFFEPTFQKHKGQLCAGFQIHIDHSKYDHKNFKPYRIVAATLKAIRQNYSDFDLWLSPPYEYEKVNMPIDILSGHSFLREWVDDKTAKWGDLDSSLNKDEKRWATERREHLLY